MTLRRISGGRFDFVDDNPRYGELSKKEGKQIRAAYERIKREKERAKREKGRCTICSKKDWLGKECKFCGEFHCSKHILPEEHRCTNIGAARWKEEPYRIPVSEVSNYEADRYSPYEYEPKSMPEANWQPSRPRTKMHRKISNPKRDKFAPEIFSNEKIQYVIGFLIIWGLAFFLFKISILIPIPLNEKVVEQNVFEYINEIREQNGINKLEKVEVMDGLAKIHSEKMRDAGNIFHSTDNLGENVALIPQSGMYVLIYFVPVGFYNTEEATSRASVEAWMNSPGHRSNILNSTYTKTGIGASCTLLNCYYTQNFI